MKQENLKMKERCKVRFASVLEAVKVLETIAECPVLVGIDGMCATGKTTLGYYLKEQFDCNLFHMDDFFLRPEQRTQERMAEVGGNVDYERFYQEVLEPLTRGEEVLYRPYCCQTGKIGQAENTPYKRLNIVEGSYSLHPHFGDVYHLRIFTEGTPERQLQNIRERNGEEMLQRFVNEWIPKENAYFDQFRIREGCLIVPWTEA